MIRRTVHFSSKFILTLEHFSFCYEMIIKEKRMTFQANICAMEMNLIHNTCTSLCLYELQEPLKSGVKADIRDDLRSLPDVCKTLDNVDIAIHFLKTTGGKQEDKLHIYMVNKLQMSQDCNCSQTVRSYFLSPF